LRFRGYRIEPGEIEEAALRHPGVSAIHLVLLSESSSARLVAYVVLNDEQLLTAVRQQIDGSLPAHMLSAVVPVSKMPLTVNGKVDERALAEAFGTGGKAAVDGPSRKLRDLVLGIWAEAFGRDIQEEDDFFSLGGNSLLAFNLVNRLTDRTGISVDLIDLFESRTVGRLLEVMGHKSDEIVSRSGGDPDR
jgi:acyl carrier protein